MLLSPLPFSIILVAIQAYRWKQQEQLQEGLVWWLSILCLSAYLPFYVDGSALDGRRAGSHTKWFVKLPLWRFIWCRLLGMPECKVLWEEKQFPSVDSQGNEQRFIFCSHPHGVMSAHHIGPMICPGTCEGARAFADVPGADPRIRRDLSASILFRVPLLREVMLWSGCVDASRKVAERLLRTGAIHHSNGQKKAKAQKEGCEGDEGRPNTKEDVGRVERGKKKKKPFRFGDRVGHSLAILVGGEREQLLAQRGEHTVFVSKRKGHVRLALRFGVPLVPCYAFGEVDTYDTSTFLLPLRLLLVKALGVAVPLGIGRSPLLPFLPRPVKLVHCVGDPIYPYGERGETAPRDGLLPDVPSAEAVEALHAKYVDGLRAVFDKHKSAQGYPHATLKIL